MKKTVMLLFCLVSIMICANHSKNTLRTGKMHQHSFVDTESINAVCVMLPHTVYLNGESKGGVHGIIKLVQKGDSMHIDAEIHGLSGT
jgi:hypothetical protein